MATESTEEHERINSLKDIFPCNSVCFRGKFFYLYEVEKELENM